MLELVHDFPIKTYQEIKSFIKIKMKDYNERNLYVVDVKLPSDILDKFNKELSSYNLPELNNCLVFKRKNHLLPLAIHAHVDYNSSMDEIVNSSIVLPIEGYDRTYMFWMEGKYKTEKAIMPSGNSYQSIKWETDPTILDKKEIITPTLCRVNIPHDACNSINDVYRVIASIRLKINLPFEEIIKRRFSVYEN